MGTAPDPNPVCLSLPYGGDLQLTPNGSLVFVSGVERIRQRIIRRFFTCPEENLIGVGYIPADYIFDPNYGIGAVRLVGEPTSTDEALKLKQKVKKAVLVDEGVDTNQDPLITLFAAPNGEIWASVTVYLLDGTQTNLIFPSGNKSG